MAIFVRINPGCEVQAKKHGQLGVVRRVADDIERQQSIDNLHKHLPSHVVEKDIGRSYRLYGVEILYREGEYRVICFSEVFAKGEKPEFHRQLEDERIKKAFIIKSEIPEGQRDVPIRKKLAEGVKERLPVSATERQYLEIARSTLHRGKRLIFESRDWVKCLRKADARKFLRPVALHICELLDLEVSQRRKGTRFPENSDRGLLYRQFESGLFLVSPAGIPGAAFARYIGSDYSGAETPNASLKGLRAYQATNDVPAAEVLPPPSPRKYSTPRGLAEWLMERLTEDVTTLIGVDNGTSFPLCNLEVHHTHFESRRWRGDDRNWVVNPHASA